MLTNALIGEYRLEELLGAGGMGEVYKAVHTHLGRVIAVKVLSPNMTDGPALQRFYNEASIQASLKHPSVAEYLGFYEYQGRPCILMEYVNGETLSSIVRERGALPPVEAARILREVASGIAHFHAQGVVHRDLKTSNIKISKSGQVKILDFGIARHQRSDRLTHMGSVVGTTESLAPEQVRGESAGFPTDVWQLGVLFYELLTGHLPFEANTTHEIYQRILSADYVPVQQMRPNVPDVISRIVVRCLQKEPSRRYATAFELFQELSAVGQRAVPAQPTWISRVRRTWAWISVAVLLVVIAISYGLFGRKGTPENVPGATAIHTEINEGDAVSAHYPGLEGGIKTITVDTMDGAAQVLREERPVGVTPFQIKAHVGENVDLILRRDGFEDLPIQFDVSERSVYTYVLKSRKDH